MPKKRIWAVSLSMASSYQSFFGEMPVVTILTFMIPVNTCQGETSWLNFETIFPERYRGLIISHGAVSPWSWPEAHRPCVYYWRNIPSPVLVDIEWEEVKRVDSYKYLEVQINKKTGLVPKLWSPLQEWTVLQKFSSNLPIYRSCSKPELSISSKLWRV